MTDDTNEPDETRETGEQEQEQNGDEQPPAPDRYGDDERRDIDVSLTGVRMADFPPETAASVAADILTTLRGEYSISAAGVEIDHPNADVRWSYDGGPATVFWHDPQQRVEYRKRNASDHETDDDRENESDEQ
jgi:hypothetical protein